MIHHTYSLEVAKHYWRKNLKKSRVQSVGLESSNLEGAIPRYEMWKAIRTKSDEQMTSQSTQMISQKIVSTNLI